MSHSSHAIVVLIHGLGRTAGCWRPLERVLKRHGFDTVAIDYPSTRFDIADLAMHWVGPKLSAIIGQALRTGMAVHVVTHSMGGIVLRYWLQRNDLPQRSRVVMLAPPNHGSEVIDRFERFQWFHRLMGPAAMQLSTSPLSWVNNLPSWTSEARLGIIAGTRSADPWFNRWFDGLHDGKVAVGRAYLRGCAQLYVIRRSHTWIMKSTDVLPLITDYLQNGEISPPID